MNTTHRLRLFSITLLALLAAAPVCGDVTCDEFGILADLDDQSLTIRIKTDLPDETIVMVIVGRTYYKRSVSDAYSEDYLSERSTVGEWRRPHQISVSDQVFERALEQRKRMFVALGEPFTVKSISDDIKVSFVVPINQTDPRFGPRNENLRGRMVQVSGLRVIRVEEKIRLPLGDPARTVAARTPVHAQHLVVGRKYRVESRTPLMPKFEASSASDLGRVRYVGAGGVIEILERKDKRSTPWYRVHASTKEGRRIGSGWINSAALLPQNIWAIKSAAKSNSSDSYTRLGPVVDSSYAGVKRLSVKIEIPVGRSRHEVEATLKKAATDLDRETRPNALMVYGYMPGDDYESSQYTVGRAVYAPNGRWGEAHKGGRKRFTIDIGKIYFQAGAEPESYQPGARVPLRLTGSEVIAISRSFDSWGASDIIGRVAGGVIAEIIERKTIPITSDHILVTYLVEVRTDSMMIRGWVAQSNVEAP